jgi:hypothetical protein
MGHQNALKQRGRSSSEAFLSGDLKPGSRERLGSWRSLTIGALGWPTIFKDRPARSFELVLSVPPTAMLSAFCVWKGWLRLTMPAVWSRLFLVQYVHQGGVGTARPPHVARVQPINGGGNTKSSPLFWSKRRRRTSRQRWPWNGRCSTLTINRALGPSARGSFACSLAIGAQPIRAPRFRRPVYCRFEHNVSTRDVLAEYAQRRDRFLPTQSSPRFLLNDHSRCLESSTVRRTFYNLSRQIGLRGPDDRTGPRLHDFRHRFALMTLIQWYRKTLNSACPCYLV